jgi:hypothetical protein
VVCSEDEQEEDAEDEDEDGTRNWNFGVMTRNDISIITGADYMDYDSDYETKADAGTGVTDVDPYSGWSSFHPSSINGAHRLVQAFFSPKIVEKK